MKVVHIIWGFGLGGSESILVEVLNGLSTSIDVSLVIINEEYYSKLLNRLSPKVNIIRIGRTPGSKNLWYFLKLRAILFRSAPDIVVCHNNNIISLLKGGYFKKVIHVHDIGIKLEPYLSQCDLVLSISKAVSADIVTRSSCKEPLLVYNGIPTKDIVKRVDWKLDVFRIVQVSSVDHHHKGQDILIRAVRHCINHLSLNTIRLDFIGTGPSLEEMRALCKELKLEEHCSFLGKKPREYVYEHLKDYHLLVQPSRYEGFGNTVIEGLAAKIPVLVSNLDGPAEIISEGKYGYSFEPDNYVNCANAIRQIYDEYGTTSFIDRVNTACNYVLENYDISRTVARFLEVYEQLATV